MQGLPPDTLPSPDALIERLCSLIAPRLSPDTVMVGIHSGGVWVAERLHALLQLATPMGMLDISFYRDDFSRIGLHPQVRPSRLPFDLEDRPIILVDDVLNTGRTVRAAMNELFDYGRPAAIRLAVLVDRGGHELPICPDYVGLTLDIPAGQNVNLSLESDATLKLGIQ